MFVAENKNGKMHVLPAKEIRMLSGIDEKMLNSLARKPAYPKNLAKKLGIDEQPVYYHIRQLEKKGLIKIVSKEERGAAVAKIYALSSRAFVMKFSEMSEAKKVPAESDFLSPFISDGRLNAKIVVGSPDPHGPEKARSRDAAYAIDLALFLGTFLSDFSLPSMSIDIEMNDMKKNLILIGGPIINKVTRKINDKMPVRFVGKNIHSSVSKKTYRNDDCGLIVKMDNPFDREKKILVVAGKRFSGTRAAIIALIKKFDEISKKNHRVVEGIDSDYDGIIDDVRILE